jgi:hypothetical protein
MDRNREIVDLAEAIAQDHFPETRVEPLEIVRAKGITYCFESYLDAFDGLLEHKSGRFHIYCNLDRLEGETTPRARFTLCHELGHFFIDDHRQALQEGRVPAHPSKCEFESDNPVEKEADQFASCLLMPSSRFIAIAKKMEVGLGSISGLAEHFGTSMTSTANRYVNLQVKPCTVIKWTEKFGYGWKRLWYDTRVAGFRKTIERIDKLPSDCATSKALRGEKPNHGQIFQNGTTASAWFPFVGDGYFKNIILIEQAMRLGRFGVLTFLYPEAGSFPWVDAA